MALNDEQRANARIIMDVGQQVGASQRDILIALMTAMQESGLRNLDYGDRDSLGLFQQRPSMGWGSKAQVTDPYYAARTFFQGKPGNPGLFSIKDRDKLALTQAAQKVQRSAFPDAYAKHESVARELLGDTEPAPPPPPVRAPARPAPPEVNTGPRPAATVPPPPPREPRTQPMATPGPPPGPPGGDTANDLLSGLSPEARAQYERDLATLDSGGQEKEYVPWYGPGLGRGRDIEQRVPGQRVKRKKPVGLLTPGNIDPGSLPMSQNEDGTPGGAPSISIEEDGVEVLIPAVGEGGRVLTDEEAIEQYRLTGQHLGKFDSRESADTHGEDLRQDQEASVDWDDTVAGAKGQRIHPGKSAPIEPGMGHVEMSEKEVHGGAEMSLTPEQQESQARRDRHAPGSPDSEIWKDADEVLFDPYNWDPEDLEAVGKQMQDVGLLKDGPYSMPDFLAAWKQLVGQSAVYNKVRPGQLATPLDMLDINYGDPARRAEIQAERASKGMEEKAKKQLNEPYGWTPEQRAYITRRMQDTGLLGEKYSNKEVSDVWRQLVGDSLELNQANPDGGQVDPMGMLEKEYGNPENLAQVEEMRAEIGKKRARAQKAEAAESRRDAAEEMLKEPYRWDPAKFGFVSRMMQDAGLLPEQFTSDDVVKVWADIVEKTMAFNEANSGGRMGPPGPPGGPPMGPQWGPPGPGPMGPPGYGPPRPGYGPAGFR